MTPNILILGSTLEAAALAQAVADRGIAGMVSVADPAALPAHRVLPHRAGGFGGTAGLARFLDDEAITHLVDATHPFAARMSGHAIEACAETGVPLIALTREPWAPVKGDDWRHVPDIGAAVRALDGPARRIMLALGNMHLAEFAVHRQHFYYLRLIDPPTDPLSFADCLPEIDPGPFSEEGDRLLMEAHGIDLVVSRNAGGTGAYAKIAAARRRGIPVLMIDRPRLPERLEAHTLQEVLNWLGQTGR